MELFVSDLDGTLLNHNKEISRYSKEELNKLINKGIQFTVATARTPATVVELLKGVDIKLPVILMNGVLIYDIKNNKYIDVKSMHNEIVNEVLRIFSEYNKNPLVYGIKNDGLLVFYKEFAYEIEHNFYKERYDSPLKTFVKVEEFDTSIKDSKIINFIAFDRLEVIQEIYNKLLKVKGLTVNYYEELYDKGWYYIEAYSADASKANGIKFLADYVEHSRVITFGDNVNDIPMFEISDECYAVNNAKAELKNISTAVIGDNNDDSVVKFIKKRFTDNK